MGFRELVPRSESFTYLIIGIVLLAGVAISIGVTQVVRASEQDRSKQEFHDNAIEQIFTLRTGVETRVKLVSNIAAFYAASSFVDRDEFAIFSRSVTSMEQGVQALSWIPRVTDDEVSLFEQSARLDDLSDFYIKQLGPAELLVPVSDRAEYFPVVYIEPIAGNESALGFDLSSNPSRLSALQIARDTGSLTLTAPINLVQETGNQTGFLAFAPIYEQQTDTTTVDARRENLTGLASGVFRVEDLVNGIFRSQLETNSSIAVELRVEDVTDPENVELIFKSHSTPVPESERSIPIVSSSMEIGGRKWLVTATPSQASYVQASGWIPWLILAAGLAITLITAAFLYTTVRRAGTIRKLVEQRTSQLSDSNEQLIFQINERQKNELELRDSEARTNAIVDLAVDAIITIDDNGTIETANRASENVFDYRSEDMIGQNMSMVMPSTFDEEFGDYIRNYTDSGQKSMIGIGKEVVGRRSDGSTFPMEMSVSEVSLNNRRLFTVIVRDITERKAAEESLRKSEAAKESLLNAIPDSMLRVNRDGICIDYRAGQEKDALAVQPELFIGFHIGKMLSLETVDVAVEHIKECFSSGKPQSFEYQLKGEPGRPRTRDLEARVHVSGPDEVLVLIRDITDRRALERMKAEFVSTVSHELRTPITSIRGALGLLAGTVAEDAPEHVTQMLKIGISNTDRLTRLINDILDLERLESGKVELHLEQRSLKEIVEGAVDGVKILASNAGVSLDSAVEDLTISVDSDKVAQVLINLVSNAIKFSDSGKTINVNAVQSDEGAYFSVHDEGRGIPYNKQESIFGRFQQVDSSDSKQKGGTGLGLAICKNIVELHGGRIWVTSEPDKGSTFHFVLPVNATSNEIDRYAA